MKLTSVATFAMFSMLASNLACSAGGDGNGSSNSHGNNNTGATSNTGVGDQPNLDPTAGSLNLNTGGNTGSGAKDPNDPRDVPVRTKTCDANGENCTCLRLALLGTLDSAADDTDTQPFIEWLNGNSGGTAVVTMVSTKPTIDAAFLANYDVLLVANVNSWNFSADEKTAVQTWVHDMGGGMVTLTGFVSTATEAAATSQLIDFAGMGYTGTGMGDWTAPDGGGNTPVTYNGGSENLKNCMNLWNGAGDSKAAITTSIPIMPQTGTLEKLTDSLSFVGAYIGWPVKAPTGSTVIATDPMSGKNIAVALEYEGRGRIFSFGDEWVIFANQWQPRGQNTNMSTQGNPCYVPAAGTAPAFYHSVKTLYQTKQFWYDAINWVAPPSECNFTIDDPDVVVK